MLPPSYSSPQHHGASSDLIFTNQPDISTFQVTESKIKNSGSRAKSAVSPNPGDSMPSSMKKQPVVSQRGYRDNLLGRRTKSARSTHYAHRASARQDPAFFATRYKLGILGFLRKPYATPFRQRHSRPRKRTGKADEPALRRSAPSS